MGAACRNTKCASCRSPGLGETGPRSVSHNACEPRSKLADMRATSAGFALQAVGICAKFGRAPAIFVEVALSSSNAYRSRCCEQAFVRKATLRWALRERRRAYMPALLFVSSVPSVLRFSLCRCGPWHRRKPHHRRRPSHRRRPEHVTADAKASAQAIVSVEAIAFA